MWRTERGGKRSILFRCFGDSLFYVRNELAGKVDRCSSKRDTEGRDLDAHLLMTFLELHDRLG